jgi:hypothetical protein
MKSIGLLIFCLFLNSCGESPLWNHAMEKSGLTKDTLGERAESYKFAKTKFSFTIDWITGPLKGENKFILKSWHQDLGTLSGPYQDLPNDLHIYLWMPDMGHGSAPVKIKKLGSGEYEVTNVYFIMGGGWEVFFQLLKNKDEVLDEVILPITL